MRPGEDLVDQVVDEGDRRVAVRAVEVPADPLADLAAQVEEGGGEGALAEVEGDDVAGVVDERDERRLLAAGAGAAADLAGEALAARGRATSSPTEVRVRPVRRAISARLIGPRS